ncbi:unnamed protein product, partial [Urochloa humidicola]
TGLLAGTIASGLATLVSPLAAASKRTVAQAGGPASASRHSRARRRCIAGPPAPAPAPHGPASASRHPRARRRCVAGPPAPAPHEHAPMTGCAIPIPPARRLLGGRGEARHGGRAATGADVSCPLLVGTPCVARSHPFYLFAIAAPLSLPPAAPRGLLLPPSFSPLIKPVAMHMAPDPASRRDGSTPAARIQRRASFRPCHNPSSRVMAAAQAGGG